MTHGRKICISVVDELCLCTARFLRSRITNCEHRFEQNLPPRFWRSVGVLIEGDTCMPRSLKLGPGMHCGKAELVMRGCSRVQPSCRASSNAILRNDEKVRRRDRNDGRQKAARSGRGPDRARRKVPGTAN